MGKSFLDRLDDAFGAETLSDVIPNTVTPPPPPKRRPNRRKSVSKRKKSFLENIDENMAENTPKSQKRGKKSFLDTIEEALEDRAFDDLFPTRKDASRRKTPDFDKKRFNILLTTQVLKRARQIARQKSIDVDDVINIALQRYIEVEGK